MRAQHSTKKFLTSSSLPGLQIQRIASYQAPINLLFTDLHQQGAMSALSLVCGQCGVQLKSVKEAQEHGELTGHSQFEESTEPVSQQLCKRGAIDQTSAPNLSDP